jgi:hypothetical protein
MTDPGNISPENRPVQGYDAVTMAAQFFDSNGLLDFARKHPESEYRLWLLTRPEDADLRQLSEKRTRSFERMPMYDKIRAAGCIAAGAALDVVVVMADVGLGAKVVMGGLFTSIFYNNAKSAIKDIPDSRRVALQQRALHESVFGVE